MFYVTSNEQNLEKCLISLLLDFSLVTFFLHFAELVLLPIPRLSCWVHQDKPAPEEEDQCGEGHSEFLGPPFLLCRAWRRSTSSCYHGFVLVLIPSYFLMHLLTSFVTWPHGLPMLNDGSQPSRTQRLEVWFPPAHWRQRNVINSSLSPRNLSSSTK